MSVSAGQDPHGRGARSPSEIPARGWKDVLYRVKEQIGSDNISIVAAGVAFYFFLAVFPGLAALASLYGLVADPADVERMADVAAPVIPQDALAVIQEQIHALVSSSSQTLSITLIISVMLALWSATAGTKALMTALDIAYDEEEKRGFFRFTWTAIWLTLAGIIFAILSLALIAAVPPLLEWITLPKTLDLIINWARWPLLAIAVVVVLAVLYRFGPSRESAQWQWLSWGAAVGTALWIIGSIAFSLYVSNFGDYNKTYGAFAGVVILLLWFYLAAFIVLLGAEFNAELEHQTAVDTTTGDESPMGQRGAKMADTLGELQSKGT